MWRREINIFIQSMRELLVLKTHTGNPHRPNLSKEEFNAIKHLKENNQLVIREADKGAAVVVLSAEQYRTEALRQLSNANTYRPLRYNPTETFKMSV